MQPLPRPSVSPLYSFCSTRPDAVPRYVSFSETLQAVWRWLRGVEPGWRERAREARMVEALAEVMAAETEEDAVHRTTTVDAKGKTTGEGHGATAT
jgi:hypothetical protein